MRRSAPAAARSCCRKERRQLLRLGRALCLSMAEPGPNQIARSIIDSQRSRHVERVRGNAAHRVWSVLRTSGGNLQPVMGTPLASGAALPRRACLRSRGDTVSAGSGRTSHNAADAPLQSTGGGTRSGTPWTGRSRRSGEDASQPHNKGLELRHEIADPTPKVLYATFRMRAPTHPKSVHPSLTPAQPCLGCLQIGPHSNQEKSLFE